MQHENSDFYPKKTHSQCESNQSTKLYLKTLDSLTLATILDDQTGMKDKVDIINKRACETMDCQSPFLEISLVGCHESTIIEKNGFHSMKINHSIEA